MVKIFCSIWLCGKKKLFYLKCLTKLYIPLYMLEVGVINMSYFYMWNDKENIIFSHKLNELPVHIYNKWLEGMKQLNYSLFTQFIFHIVIRFIYLSIYRNKIYIIYMERILNSKKVMICLISAWKFMRILIKLSDFHWM